MIRKGQARWVSGSDVRQQIQFIHNLFEVRHEPKPGRLDQSRSCRFLKVATHPLFVFAHRSVAVARYP